MIVILKQFQLFTKFMENKNVLIIGIGNIGSRYYEGLIKTNKKFKLFIYDKNKKKYFKDKKKFIYFLNNINDVCKINNFFLTTIATTADERGSLLKKLKINSRFWILEKPLGSSFKQINLIKKKFKLSNNAYINMPRENWKIYKKIKKLFKNKKVQMRVIGTNWNLASNSFHFFRLFEWINDSKLKSVDAKNINAWFSSKRKTYHEVDGSITAKLFNGSSCSLTSKKTIDNKKKYSVNLNSINNIVNYEEMTGKLKINNKNYIYKIPLLSNEINHYYKQFLHKKKIYLPKVKNEILSHKMILKELQFNWKKKFKRKNKLKIT